jgi:uncharacterized protein YaaN involved in tellurite resistance
MAPPEPVPAVSVEQVDEMVQLDASITERLDEKVAAFVDSLVDADVDSPPFEERMSVIHNLGNEEIRAAASVSNRILNRPVNTLDENPSVSESLLELRKTVEDLDPSKQGNLRRRRRFLGIFSFGDPVKQYFRRYQSAQSHIDAVMDALHQGQDALRQDNATIEEEKGNMWGIMQKLQQYIYVGRRLDVALSARVSKIEAEDPRKAQIVKEELLFYVRQKIQDLLMQLSVTVQGYLSLDMIRKTNTELIKGVDRATTTTISALRTAVIVAQALASQKLVLDQINALNETTGSLVASTAERLKAQTSETYGQATDATVDLERLRAAFNNIYETMDMIATYKAEALDNMQQTVVALAMEVDRARSYIDRVRGEEVAEAAGDLALDVEEAGYGPEGAVDAEIADEADDIEELIVSDAD